MFNVEFPIADSEVFISGRVYQYDDGSRLKIGIASSSGQFWDGYSGMRVLRWLPTFCEPGPTS